MSNQILFGLWGLLFIICAGLGFIPEPGDAGRAALTLAGVAFFVPPFVLLYRAKNRKALGLRQLLRNLAALSLGATLALLILNLISAFRSEWVGNALHYALTIVSTPMMCCSQWVISLFLWACLLVLSMGKH